MHRKPRSRQCDGMKRPLGLDTQVLRRTRDNRLRARKRTFGSDTGTVRPCGDDAYRFLSLSTGTRPTFAGARLACGQGSTLRGHGCRAVQVALAALSSTDAFRAPILVIPRPRPSLLDDCDRLGAFSDEQRWRSKDGKRLYTWDSLHGEVEVFNSRGYHLGAIHPVTGQLLKEPVKGRRINV